jgi:hypothetical protein
MAISATITLTVAGSNTGPFNLYSNIDGYTNAFESNILRSSLLAGYTTNNIPDGTATVRVKSMGSCINYIDLSLGTTPAPTTAAPTTAAPTTAAPTTAAPTTAAPTTAAPTTAAPTTAAPTTAAPTSPTLNSYLFYAAPSSINATNDFIAYNNAGTGSITFRYSGSSESFNTYITRRVNDNDRISSYTHDVCADKATITYNMNWAQKSGQSATSIAAYFIHPTSMGTITDIIDTSTSATYTVEPVGGLLGNTLGSFTYNGTSYRMYRWLGTQVPGSTASIKVNTCI